MSDDQQLVAQPNQTSLATVFGVSPQQMMDYAIEIATTIKGVLTKQGMTKAFGQGEHVLTEGWQLTGSLLGLTASEAGAVELPDGSYEATVELKSISTGRVVAVASGRCGTDESTWRNKPKYARRSMAYTRAIGRVYSQNFRWLIKLAGYEGTPAEEMPGFVPVYVNANPDQKKWLRGELNERHIADEDQKKIAGLLDGRPIDELDKIIANLQVKDEVHVL